MATETPRDVAAAWRPQRPGRRGAKNIPDAIVEPDWGGMRVVAALTEDEVALVQRGGEVPVPDELLQAPARRVRRRRGRDRGPRSRRRRSRSSTGAFPKMPTVERPPILVPRAIRKDVKDDPFVRARDHEQAAARLEPAVREALERGERHAFVATDLLWLDGSSLDDVPLLERRRILEGVLAESYLVRISAVRPAVGDADARDLGRAGLPRPLVPRRELALPRRRGATRLGRRPRARHARGRPEARRAALTATPPATSTSRPGGGCLAIPRQDRAGAANAARTVVGWDRARDDPDARHPGRDRPPRPRRHHGRHPELQERRDDRLRRPRGARPGSSSTSRTSSRCSSTPTPASPDGTQRVVVETEPPDYVESILLVRPTNRLDRVTLTYPEIDGVGGKGAALRTIFEIAAALEVQALVVVDSDLRSIVPEWIELLAGPILKGGYDYVAPLYSRYKYDGTITNTVTYPLTRALYGHRIRQPIGGDFGVSGDLVRHYLELDDWTEDISKFGIDIWMTTSALTAGSRSARRGSGAKVHDPKDPGSDLGPMFRQVVGTILRLAAAHADAWLGVRGSHDVPGLRLRADHRPAAARGERDPPAVASSTAARSRSRTPGAGRSRRPTSRRCWRWPTEAGTARGSRHAQAGARAARAARPAPSTVEMAEALAASTSPTTCGRG